MPDSLNEPPDAPDLEIRDADDDAPYETSRSPTAGVWIAAIVVLIAAAVAAYVVFSRREAATAPATAARGAAGTPAPAQPLGGQPAPIDVPPLEQSDSVVRELVRQLSSHPQVAAWLTTDGLIRNFTVVVSNTAEGTTPANQLRVLRPKGEFQVVQRGEDLVVDPRSYERYNGIAEAAASIDPQGAARLYATLKPRIEEAYGELGYPRTPFDTTLERAIVALLRTPVADGPVRVRPKGGTGYAFVDPALENLSGPQKQLLRTGPENQRKIQAALRRIALALGIPESRLPA
jgi:DUF3014 family protein